jgi:hypothetical protein
VAQSGQNLNSAFEFVAVGGDGDKIFCLLFSENSATLCTPGTKETCCSRNGPGWLLKLSFFMHLFILHPILNQIPINLLCWRQFPNLPAQILLKIS